MKAIILAAGYGTRLYPLTKNTPKPLLNLAGVPILTHLIQKLEHAQQLTGVSFDAVYIVTNDKFYPHFEKWSKSTASSLPLTVLNDLTTENGARLGSLGDIKFVVDSQQINDDVLILGGDNYFQCELDELLLEFLSHGTTTILVHDVKFKNVAKHLGIVKIDTDQKVTEFIEKPEFPPSTLASTLIYVIAQKDLKLLDAVTRQRSSDNSGEYISYLVEHSTVRAISLTGDWFDIGTPQQLKRAREVAQRSRISSYSFKEKFSSPVESSFSHKSTFFTEEYY